MLVCLGECVRVLGLRGEVRKALAKYTEFSALLSGLFLLEDPGSTEPFPAAHSTFPSPSV